MTEISFLDCGSLVDPGDGSVNFTSTTYDSQATYICKTGYLLVGSETRVCLANETWSDTAPICQIKGNTLLEKYSVNLKTLLQQGISEPEFYGDLVYRFRKIVGKSNFSEQFRKLINRYKRIGYSLDIMRQTACLDVNPITLDGYASLFNCTTAVRASDTMTASS